MAAKYIRIANLLRSEIPKLRAAGVQKLPPESAIMAQQNVSRQTVRQALAILADEGLIEKRRGSGTYISGSHSTSIQIAVIASYLSDYIFPTLLRDVQAVLAYEGYTVSVYATENSIAEERKILQRLLREPVAGILIEGVRTALPNPNLDLYEQIQQQQIPLVFLHGVYPDLHGAICVSDDNCSGGYQLVRHLINRGHTQIAGIFKCDDAQGHARYRGSVNALRDASLLSSDKHFLWYTTDDRQQLIEGRDMTLLRRFLEHHLHPCTAVVCYNDEIAYYLIKLLQERGLRVPQDVAVVSFDNSYYSDLSAVRITSLGHAPHAVGHTAAYRLLDLIRGRRAKSEAIAWELHERESS